MRDRHRIVTWLAVVVLLAAACAPAASPSVSPSGGGPTPGPTASVEPTGIPTEYPRDQTLYTSGTQYGPPSNWNPIMDWTYATGTLGFVYEPLFNYDPLADTWQPWLAESGEWTGDTEYTLTLRDGITWTDGEPLTAEDVVFTVDLRTVASVPYSTLSEFLDEATAVDELTVEFTFSEPAHQQWSQFLYNRSILPKHIWEGRSEDEIMGTNENPIGSGPYLYLTHSQDRMVWVKNDNWWGKDALGLDPKPKYIVDIVNGGNNVMLGLVLQGGIDLSNNFLPGVATLLEGGYGLQTYYDEPPYMLSANTAWLVTNDAKAPLSDAAFRKALAHSIDVDRIVNNVYGRLVKAADPTGLLPTWEKFVDQDVVDRLGFSYDPVKARQLLADAGYKDTNGDGFVENTDGSAISLTIIVPNGWTDWMESIRVIAESAKAVGINVTPDFPDYNARTAAIHAGDFDLAIMNDQQMSNTPWSYYWWVFRLPVQADQNAANFGRYENEEAWDLVNELDRTPVDDVDGMQEIMSQLEEILLTDLPIIPVWYNGVWSQANNSVWTNWPSDTASHILPCTWRGYWQMGALRMLDALELAPTD